MIDKQFEELKLTGNLPSPHGVGLAILQATQREEVDLEEVVRILQADPTLTGRILKLANSVSQGSQQPARTVREAAVRVGLRSVRNVGLGFSLLAGNRSGRCKAFDYDGYWSHSLATAVSCQALAELRRDVKPGEAFTLGLLCGIGRLALASVHPEAYSKVLQLWKSSGSRPLADIEQECLGTHHRELAAALLRDWNLPRVFANVVALGGPGQRVEDLEDPAEVALSAVLQSARDLARILTMPAKASPALCRRRLSELDELGKRLGLEAEGVLRLWNEVVEGWARWGDTMRVRARPQMSIDELREAASRREPERVEPPAERSSTGVSAPDEALPEAPHGLRVLLALNDGPARRQFVAHLEEDGHQVVAEGDGQTALSLALERAPHVLITEWGLTGLSGPRLVSTLRQSELGKRMHAVLMTHVSELERVLEAFELGVDEYLGLPCDARVLQARVRAAQRVVTLDERVNALLRERQANISQLIQAKRTERLQAITDALTGLHNRRYAMERLAIELEAARRDAKPLSVMMVDIDRFKAVNDGHGHDVGDIVLREVARGLNAGLRGLDMVCRLGGEEFLVICPRTGLADATRVAQRLCDASRERVIPVAGFARAVTISLGVATLEPGCEDVDALIKRADERVYLAKQAGRDRVVAAGPRAADVRQAG